MAAVWGGVDCEGVVVLLCREWPPSDNQCKEGLYCYGFAAACSD